MRSLTEQEVCTVSGYGGQAGIFWPTLNGFGYTAIIGVVVSYYTSNPNWILALGLTGGAVSCFMLQLEEAEELHHNHEV
jgi:hypothetical protein